MQKTKRLSILFLVLALIFSALFVMSSCSDDENELEDGQNQSNSDNPGGHTHSYSETVVEPTCTEDGYTTYTCSCGDTYTGAITDAKGHDYRTIVKEYPTISENGRKISVCRDCSAELGEQTIDALVLSMPRIADILQTAIKGAKLTLAADQGSTLIWSHELDDYTVDDGYKTFVLIEVAEAEIDTTAEEIKGHIKFAFGTSTVALDGTVNADTVNAPRNHDNTGSLSIYLNGDEISFELTDFDGSKENETFSINEMVYTAIADSLGISADEFISSIYLSSYANKFIPLLENLLPTIANGAPVLGDDYIEMLASLCESLGADFFTETVKSNGDTVYTVNVQSLNSLLTLVENKTLTQIVDEMYGEGTAESLSDFIIGLPGMKLSKIADSAITFAENSGVAVDDIYYYINFMVYNLTGTEDFDFESVLKDNYNLTLIELLSEGATPEDITEFKASLKDAVESISAMTVDELYNMVYGFDEEFSLTEEIKSFLEMMNNAARVQVVIDKDGILSQIIAEFDIYSALITFAEDQIYCEIIEDGVTAVSATVQYSEPEDGINVYSFTLEGEYCDNVNVTFVINANEEAYELVLSYEDTKVDIIYSTDFIGFTVCKNDYTAILSEGYISSEAVEELGLVVATKVKADLVVDQNDLFDFEIVVSEDCVESIYVAVRDEIYDSSIGDTVLGNLFSIDYTYGEDKSELDITVWGDVIVGYEEEYYDGEYYNYPIYEHGITDEIHAEYTKTESKNMLTVTAENDTAVFYYEFGDTMEKVGFEAYSESELIASGYIKADLTEENGAITRVAFTADYVVEDDDLLDLYVVIDNGAIESADVTARILDYDSETDEYNPKEVLDIDYTKSTNRDSITLTFESTDKIVFYYDFSGEMEKVGFEVFSDGTLIGNAYVSPVTNVEGITDGLKVFAVFDGVTVADATICVTSDNNSVSIIYNIKKILVEMGYNGLCDFTSSLAGNGKITISAN